MIKIEFTKNELHWLFQIMTSYEAMGDSMATKIINKIPIDKI